MKAPAQLVHHAPREFAGLGPLPVRVRRATGEIVGSGVTGVPIEVPPGSYFVTVLLPDGREVGHDQKVRAVTDGTAGVRAAGAGITARAETASSPGAKRLTRGKHTILTVAPTAPAAPPETASLAAADLSIAAGLWEGSWIGAWAESAPVLSGVDTSTQALSSGETLVIPHRPGNDRLLVLPLEDRYRCAVIPYDECAECADAEDRARAIGARLSMTADGPVVLFRSMVSDETNALLGFVESWLASHMATITEAQVRTSEEALSQARRSIFRGITAAYVMLRANALDGLEPWLATLGPMESRLPDLLPLRAELAARRGDHQAAVELIAQWLLTGRCPWFRAGFSYMLERLKLYLDVTDNRRVAFRLPEADYGRFAAARDTLDRMLPTMLTSCYVATFDITRGS